MSIVLRFFPNGEFSQGIAALGKPSPRHVCPKLHTTIEKRIITNEDLRNLVEQRGIVPPRVYSVQGYHFQSSCGVRYSLDRTTATTTRLLRVGDISDYRYVNCDTSIHRLVHFGLLTPIGLSDARILTESSQSRKKLLSMTRNMGRNLRNAIYLLEEKYGKEQLSFLTLTLPNLSRDGLASCCSNWDVMVNTFTKWLRNRLEHSCLELEYGYCTEIQLGRLKNRGEYAPHLHLVFRGKAYRKQPWAVSWLDCRNAWADIISRYTNESFDTRALENIQSIKKSAARYLSKYLSKGKNCIPECADDETPIKQLHTQWGGMSRHLSRAVKSRIIRFTSESGLSSLAMDILHSMDVLIEAGIVTYFSRRFISLGINRSTGSEVGLHVGVGALACPTHISLPLCLQFISAL